MIGFNFVLSEEKKELSNFGFKKIKIIERVLKYVDEFDFSDPEREYQIIKRHWYNYQLICLVDDTQVATYDEEEIEDEINEGIYIFIGRDK